MGMEEEKEIAIGKQKINKLADLLESNGYEFTLDNLLLKNREISKDVYLGEIKLTIKFTEV